MTNLPADLRRIADRLEHNDEALMTTNEADTIRRAADALTWRRVEDVPSHFGMAAIVLDQDRDSIQVSAWDECGWLNLCDGHLKHGYLEGVTHWMPLPPSPEQEQ